MNQAVKCTEMQKNSLSYPATNVLQATRVAQVKAFHWQALGNLTSEVQIHNLSSRMTYWVWLLFSSQQPAWWCALHLWLKHANILAVTRQCLQNTKALTLFFTPPCYPLPTGRMAGRVGRQEARRGHSQDSCLQLMGRMFHTIWCHAEQNSSGKKGGRGNAHGYCICLPLRPLSMLRPCFPEHGWTSAH